MVDPRRTSLLGQPAEETLALPSPRLAPLEQIGVFALSDERSLHPLQQLEAAGLVETQKNKGRVVTKEGRRTLDKLATEIKEELEKKLPEIYRRLGVPV